MFVFDKNINAKLIHNVVTRRGDRLFSALIVIPRIILAELNTHKMLAKNSASSRAIPAKKMLKALNETPFIPSGFQKAHSGMQGVEYIIDLDLPVDPMDVSYSNAVTQWTEARDYMMEYSSNLTEIDVTKQISNRLLEPFMYHTVLISGSKEGWENFFKLRCPVYRWDGANVAFRSRDDMMGYYHSYDKRIEQELGDYTGLQWAALNKGLAEIHIMQIAEHLWDLYKKQPLLVDDRHWIIPYDHQFSIDQFEAEFPEVLLMGRSDANKFITEHVIKIGTAMAARTSYTIVGEEKEITYKRLCGIYDEMLVAKPPHQSPQEQLYRTMDKTEYFRYSRTYTICGPLPEHIKEDVDTGITSVDSIMDFHPDEGYLIREYGWCKHVRGFIPLRHLIEATMPLI